MRTYDDWKTTDPADAELGPRCAHCRTACRELHLLGREWLCQDCLDDQLFCDKCENDR